jgi:subtilisin family serine protease
MAPSRRREGSLLSAFLLLLLPWTVFAQRLAGGNFLGLPISNYDATDIIPDRFIVVYNSTYSSEQIQAKQALVMSEVRKRSLEKRTMSGHILSSTVRLFSVNRFNAMALDADSKMILSIADQPEVAYIEAVTKVKALAMTAQLNAPLGLIRMSRRQLSGDDQDRYVFDSSGGRGITAYIIDTGIRTTHSEFQGRAKFGANFVDGTEDTDENGHGSHVAGTVGGATFGVAKQVGLVAVKVLDSEGGGNTLGVVQGMQWGKFLLPAPPPSPLPFPCRCTG